MQHDPLQHSPNEPVVDSSDVEKLRNENRRLQLDIEFLEKEMARQKSRGKKSAELCLGVGCVIEC